MVLWVDIPTQLKAWNFNGFRRAQKSSSRFEDHTVRTTASRHSVCCSAASRACGVALTNPCGSRPCSPLWSHNGAASRCSVWSLSLSLWTVLLRTVCLEENAQVLTQCQAAAALAAAYLSCSASQLNSLNLNLWQGKSRSYSTTEHTICTTLFEIENKWINVTIYPTTVVRPSCVFSVNVSTQLLYENFHSDLSLQAVTYEAFGGRKRDFVWR